MRLTSTRTFLLLLSASLFLVSCQKEISFEPGSNPNPGGGPGGPGPGGNTVITGDYDFVGMTANTLSSVSINLAGDEMKTVTTSNYTTENNTGTVKITANQFITTNFAYSINSTMNAKTYVNNMLLDDSNFPFVTSVPAQSTTSTYVRVNNDSLTVTGALGTAPDPTGTVPTGPVGVKMSWSGDTLLLKVNTTFTQTITQGGIPASFTGTVVGVTKLKKK